MGVTLTLQPVDVAAQHGRRTIIIIAILPDPITREEVRAVEDIGPYLNRIGRVLGL